MVTVPVRRLPDDAATALTAVDLVVGGVAVVATVADATVRGLRLRPVIAFGTRPLVRLGGVWRHRLLEEVDALVPTVIDVAMRRVRPTELVKRYVDIDELVASVDLDAVAARLDIEAVIARVDLDAIAARLDVEAILDRLDLTQTVLSRVDLKALVDAVLAQLDLAALAEDVLDEIDLPEIIRESTGTMASDTVRGVRMQGANADQAVSRVVDRLLLRRAHQTTGEAP
jgi:hypothetical protein